MRLVKPSERNQRGSCYSKRPEGARGENSVYWNPGGLLELARQELRSERTTDPCQEGCR